MRCTLYCHEVRREDDGRYTAHMSNDRGDESGPDVQITVTAPFEAFEEDEVPRAWFEFMCKFTRIDEKE